MTVVTRSVSAAHATPAMPRGAARAVLNGVMTMLIKTLAAVAAAIALATIAFAEAARGAAHKRKRSHIPDHIG
jgi:hypothetical protein